MGRERIFGNDERKCGSCNKTVIRTVMLTDRTDHCGRNPNIRLALYAWRQCQRDCRKPWSIDGNTFGHAVTTSQGSGELYQGRRDEAGIQTAEEVLVVPADGRVHDGRSSSESSGSDQTIRDGASARRSPVFGKMASEEWMNLHVRHAELHLSFVVPTDSAGEQNRPADCTFRTQLIERRQCVFKLGRWLWPRQQL